MNRIEAANEYHEKGFNCAQAVACAFSDCTGLDEKTLFKITEGLGAGIGGTRGTCGAITGAAVVLGLVNSTGNVDSPDSKGYTYKLSKKLVDEFQKKNGAIACHDLKGIETKKVLRSCPGCIEDAVVILESILTEEGKIK